MNPKIDHWMTVNKYNTEGCLNCHTHQFRIHITWQAMQKGVCTHCGQGFTLFNSETEYKNYIKTGSCWSKKKRIKNRTQINLDSLMYNLNWIQDEFYNTFYLQDEGYEPFYPWISKIIYKRLREYLDWRDYLEKYMENPKNEKRS